MRCVALAFFWMMAVVAIAQGDPFARGEAGANTEQEDDSFKVLPDPTGKAYFPKGSESYFTRYLSAMKEPSLQQNLAVGTIKIFRFTYLRSFNDPIAVRVTQKGEVFEARSVRLKMDREYRLVGIVHDTTSKLDPSKLKTISEEFERKDFWSPLNDHEVMLEGLDGSRWVFEFHDKDGYRMIHVWSPGRKPSDDDLKRAGIDPESLRDFLKYERVGIELLKLGGVLPKEDERY